MKKSNLRSISGGNSGPGQIGPIFSRRELIRCKHCGNIGDKKPFEGEVFTKVILAIEPVAEGEPGQYDVTNIGYELDSDTHERVVKCLACGSTDLAFEPMIQGGN